MTDDTEKPQNQNVGKHVIHFKSYGEATESKKEKHSL